MKIKTKRSWAHAYVCVSCQHHNRTTTSLSVGRSVGRYMYACTVFFPSRALPRNYTTSYIQYVPGSREIQKLFQVLLAIGSGFLRASYYITTTAAAAA